ncbi:hypothetical protein V6N11_051051 [Hibiscus sabdariffa]|uniref:Uncharacterized protein n=1 Tax=Hibiscus sabdariffa TaxID=183260 RepID=A0ABR2R389_9ROSI
MISKMRICGKYPAGDQARATQGQREVPIGEAKATQGSSSGANGDGGRQPCDTAEAGARLDNSKRTEEGLCVDKFKRIKGHVDDEQLWNCSHCLVEFINEIVGVEIGSEVYYVRESSSKEVNSKNYSGNNAGKKVGDSEDTFNALFVGKEDLFKRGEMEEPAVNYLGEMDINGGRRSIDNDQEEVENASHQSKLRNGSKYLMDINGGGRSIDNNQEEVENASHQSKLRNGSKYSMDDTTRNYDVDGESGDKSGASFEN